MPKLEQRRKKTKTKEKMSKLFALYANLKSRKIKLKRIKHIKHQLVNDKYIRSYIRRFILLCCVYTDNSEHYFGIWVENFGIYILPNKLLNRKNLISTYFQNCLMQLKMEA